MHVMWTHGINFSECFYHISATLRGLAKSHYTNEERGMYDKLFTRRMEEKNAAKGTMDNEELYVNLKLYFAKIKI